MKWHSTTSGICLRASITPWYLFEDENGILYICKYSNSMHSLSEGKFFLDKFMLNQSDKSSVSVTSRSTLEELSEYETGDVKLTSDTLSLGDKIEAGLVFTVN